MERFKCGNGEIVLIRGDITKVETDVIVNAANSGLIGGGGVDGAIHRAGGPTILEQCKKIRKELGGCPPGNAVITTAGNLKAKYIVHTVGPIWREGTKGEADILRAAYLNSLKLSAENQAERIAFPSISTGAYGYPLREAAKVALVACRDFLEEDKRIKEVCFVLFSDTDFKIYSEELELI